MYDMREPEAAMYNTRRYGYVPIGHTSPALVMGECSSYFARDLAMARARQFRQLRETVWRASVAT